MNRWFVLFSSDIYGVYLANYTDNTLANLKNEYSINNKCSISQTKTNTAKNRYTFVITTTEITLELNAASEDNRTDWVLAVEGLLSQPTVHTILQGWLEKKSGFIDKQWTDRYFVLGSSSVYGLHLAYYKDDKMMQLKRKYSISKKCDAFITTDDAGVKSFTFGISTPYHTELQLNAPNEKIRSEWLIAISKLTSRVPTVTTSLEANSGDEDKSLDVKTSEAALSEAVNDLIATDYRTVFDSGKKMVCVCVGGGEGGKEYCLC